MDLTIKEFLRGNPKVFEAANAEEAVELAQSFKVEGRYHWFRGQVRDWPPYSSLHRINASSDTGRRERAERRLHLLIDWVRQTPELAYLLNPEHVHDLFGIMQHYGIATNYIDFTTEPAVAGFFAADTTTPPTEGRACIYCLNTQNLESRWNDIRQLNERKNASIELTTLSVRNLWRLQAQHGVFVFANYNWDKDYPLDRIIFAYSGYPPYPTRERIYPEHKSSLEQLLDQYFSLENTTFANEDMRRFMEDIKLRGGHAFDATWETWPEGYYPEAFPNKSRMISLGSWSDRALRDWDVDPVEDYNETIGPTLRLKLKPTTDPAELRKAVTFGVKHILYSTRSLRSKAVDWAFESLAEPLSPDRLNSLFRSPWNGMRRLPYSEAEIAEAFGSIVALVAAGFGQTIEEDADRQSFSRCFGDGIPVGFSYRDQCGSRDGARAQASGTACVWTLSSCLRRTSDNAQPISMSCLGSSITRPSCSNSMRSRVSLRAK